jgi:hypothetical protein
MKTGKEEKKQVKEIIFSSTYLLTEWFSFDIGKDFCFALLNIHELVATIDRYKQMEERKIITTTKNELIDLREREQLGRIYES